MEIMTINHAADLLGLCGMALQRVAAVRQRWCSSGGERALRWLERHGLGEACLGACLSWELRAEI
jgi:hypothetical protein